MNKHTILVIVFNLLTTLYFLRWFFVVKGEKGKVKGLFVFFVLLIIAKTAFAECESGFDILTQPSTPIFLASFGRYCDSGYHLHNFVSSDVLYPVDGDTTSLCKIGQYRVDGVCVSWSQNDCPDDYSAITQVVFLAAGFGRYCDSGYRLQNFSSDVLYPVNGDTTLFCEIGQHRVNGACVPWPQNECGDGQFDYVSGNIFRQIPLFTSCPSGFSKNVVFNRYCDGGFVRTGADTCARPCDIPGISKLHVGNEIVIPAYREKTTLRALGVGSVENACYINVESGRESHTINIGDVDGMVYHAID